MAMKEFVFDDYSLLQLAAVAEEFVWGAIYLTDEQREKLRKKLVDRFEQVEALNRVGTKQPPDLGANT